MVLNLPGTTIHILIKGKYISFWIVGGKAILNYFCNSQRIPDLNFRSFSGKNIYIYIWRKM